MATALATVALVPSDERRTEVARTDEGVSIATSTGAVTTTTSTTVATATVAVTPAVARVNPRTATRPAAATTSTTTKPEPGTGSGLWVVHVDGSSQHRLRDWTGVSAWSPDSASLAVSSGTIIEVISAKDGHTQRLLASGAERSITCIDWSARGYLAWVTYEGELWIAPPGAAGGRLVAEHGDTNGSGACGWSPDGAFVSVTSRAVWVYTPDGVLVQQWDEGDEYQAHGKPSWSHDGRRLAVSVWGVSGTSLVVLDPLRQAAYPKIPSPSGQSITSFAWHLDNERLYVQIHEARYAAHFLARAVDGTSTRLDDVCCRRLHPLHDGRFLAFAPAYGRENKQLVVATPAFQVERVIARAEPPPAEPSMSTCYGAYFLHATVSPDETLALVTASGAYGPRCDSPAF